MHTGHALMYILDLVVLKSCFGMFLFVVMHIFVHLYVLNHKVVGHSGESCGRTSFGYDCYSGKKQAWSDFTCTIDSH